MPTIRRPRLDVKGQVQLERHCASQGRSSENPHFFILEGVSPLGKTLHLEQLLRTSDEQGSQDLLEVSEETVFHPSKSPMKESDSDVREKVQNDHEDPVGCPDALGVKILSNKAWWEQLVDGVQSARDILLSTYMYDDYKLHQALLGRLGAGARVVLLIDKESFEKGGAEKLSLIHI